MIKNSVINKEDILKLSFWLMVLFMPIHAKFWPLFNLKFSIQPSEIFAVIFLTLYYVNHRVRLNVDKYDAIALIWAAFNIFSLLVLGFEKQLLVEILKPIYLFFLYVAIRGYVSKNGLYETVKPFVFSVLFTSFLATLGWFFDLFGILNPLVLKVEYYPYFGDIARSRAFTSTPGMLSSFLLVASFLVIYLWMSSREKIKYMYIIYFVFFMLAFVFAISKTIVIMLATLILFYSLYEINLSRITAFFLRAISIFMFLFYLVASHIVVDFNNGDDIKGSQENGEVMEGFQFGDIYIAPTTYYVIKKGNFEVFKDNVLFGVGPGQYNEYRNSLIKKGIYSNKEFPAFDPHFTLLGAITELGIFAGIYLVTVFVVIFKDLKYKIKTPLLDVKDRIFGLILFSLLIGISIESITTDVMNFRQYWYLYALTAFYLTKSND
jgi:hypothetical protein